MLLNRKLVMIADPSPIFRRKLKAVIQTNETLVDIAEAETINAAEDILRNRLLDVVFLDIGFPGDEGLALIASIKERVADIRIVVLTSHDSKDGKQLSLDNGADYFLTKPYAIDLHLIDVIHDVIRRP